MQTKQDVERILTENLISSLLGKGSEKETKKVVKRWHPEWYKPNKVTIDEDQDSEEKSETGTEGR
jgi:hypothetical protein